MKTMYSAKKQVEEEELDPSKFHENRIKAIKTYETEGLKKF